MFDIIVKSYFIINLIGAIYETIRFIVKPEKEFPNNPDIPQIYKEMHPVAKFCLKCLTFMINVVFWLPFKILKPLVVRTP